jgi:hypothetical protein
LHGLIGFILALLVVPVGRRRGEFPLIHSGGFHVGLMISRTDSYKEDATHLDQL